jgi:hypothetical protein
MLDDMPVLAPLCLVEPFEISGLMIGWEINGNPKSCFPPLNATPPP